MSGSTRQAERQWRAVADEQTLWVDLDGEFAVYHRPSGRTHFLNAASRRLIDDVLREPRAADSVARALYGWSSDEQCDPALLQQVAVTLLRLEQLGLIERV